MSDVRVNRGGFSLAARISGDNADAPWLVLSNSLASTIAMWEPQRAALARHFRVMAHDTRGHGASDVPPSPYSFADLTADVIALMDHAGIAKASVMGLSLGGMTALGLAIHHPERFERVVCAAARADAPPPFVQGWDDRIAAVRAGGMAAIVEPTLERWHAADWQAAHPDALARTRAMILATPVEGYVGCAHALKGLDYLKDLGRATLPVLYVAGEKDMGAPAGAMRAMADATPGATYVELAGAAHLVNHDAAAAFEAAVLSFLAPAGGMTT
jgi:3-oxoadipate enol-lactonase